MKSTYEAQAPSKKKSYKQKQELHAIVAEAVQEALKSKPHHKKSRSSMKCKNKLKHFEQSQVSNAMYDTDSDTSVQSNQSDWRSGLDSSRSYTNLDMCINDHMQYTSLHTRVLSYPEPSSKWHHSNRYQAPMPVLFANI